MNYPMNMKSPMDGQTTKSSTYCQKPLPFELGAVGPAVVGTIVVGRLVVIVVVTVVVLVVVVVTT
jgi:hypothetical protein